LVKLINLIYLFDCASVYKAVLIGVNPTPVKAIDFVKDRFKIGSVFWIQASTGEESLTLATVRFNQGRPIVSFEGFESIESIAQLTGSELRIVEEDLSPLESGEFYHHQLIDSVVETLKGEHIGKVIRVEGSLNASRLVVQGSRDQIRGGWRGPRREADRGESRRRSGPQSY